MSLRDQTLEQQRSSDAYTVINVTLREKEKDRDQLDALPGKVRINGLLAVSAWLVKEHKPIEEALLAWLKSSYVLKQGQEKLLLEALKDLDAKAYSLATAEAIAYATWLKRWKVALYPKVDEKKPDQVKK